MAARASMADLITRLRKLVNDEASAVFSDDDLQEFLDDRRQRARYLTLWKEETRASGGSVSYLTFFAPMGDWEDSVELVDANYDSLSPDTEDLESGRWTFNAQPDYPVRLSGWTYDLYAAAADALEERGTQVAEHFTFSADGGQFVRSEKRSNLEAQVRLYRRRQRVHKGELVRGDVNVR